MSDSKEIMAMVKELDLIASSLEEAGADDELIDKVDLQAAKIQAYYSMEEPMDYDDEDEDDYEDDDDDMLVEEDVVEPMMQQPPMGGPEYPSSNCSKPMMQQPMMQAPEDLPAQMPVDVELDDVMYEDDDDMYGDDDVMEYDEDMVFANVVASVSKKLKDRGATELAAEVQALLDAEDE